MQITIPKGCTVSKAEGKTIRIKVPNSKFWIQGEQKTDWKWNIYLTEPESGYRDLITEDISTKTFSLFSSLTLKTPLPYEGKKADNPKIVKKFIKKNIKNLIK